MTAPDPKPEATVIGWTVSVQGGKGWWTGGTRFATDKRVRYVSPNRAEAVEAAQHWRGEADAVARNVRITARLVRITRKPTMPTALAVAWVSEVMNAVTAVVREKALADAERIARDPNVPLTGIADAIAALRGGA